MRMDMTYYDTHKPVRSGRVRQQLMLLSVPIWISDVMANKQKQLHWLNKCLRIEMIAPWIRIYASLLLSSSSLCVDVVVAVCYSFTFCFDRRNRVENKNQNWLGGKTAYATNSLHLDEIKHYFFFAHSSPSTLIRMKCQMLKCFMPKVPEIFCKCMNFYSVAVFVTFRFKLLISCEQRLKKHKQKLKQWEK